MSHAISKELCHYYGKRGVPNKIGLPLLRFLYVSELEKMSNSNRVLGARNLLNEIEEICSYNAIFLNKCPVISTTYNFGSSAPSFEIRIPYFEGVRDIESRVDRNIFHREQVQLTCRKLTRKELEKQKSALTDGSSVKASIWHSDRALSFASMKYEDNHVSCNSQIAISKYSVCRIRSAWRKSSYIKDKEYVVEYRVESSFFDLK